jgi:hypothetical protein
MNQIQIHKRIDEFFKAGVNVASADVANELISHNTDAKRYFFSKADEEWLKWFQDNDIFAELKKPALDITKYGYRLSELEYLTRMADKNPKGVAKIIDSISVRKETFNPEVVDRFMWITGLLPSEEIKFLLPKILRENWAQLMAPFNRSGYEYRNVVEKLKAAKDYEASVMLAEIILKPRTNDELNAIERFSISDKLFYLNDITETGIFDTFLDPENTQKEKALKILVDILGIVVKLGKDKEDSVFQESEPFYLLDVDLFNLEVDTNRLSHAREDIQNLVAICTKLIEELFTSACSNPVEVRRLYDTYISMLPDSRTLYRLKLFAITRCPNTFKEEIKDALFRVFNVGERYFEIEGGAEYHHALISGLAVLDNTTKRDYVSQVFEYFGAVLGDKDKEIWRKRDGLKILMYIKNELTESEITKAENLFGKFPTKEIDPPHPDFSGIRGGMVSHRSPFNLAEYSIPQIIEHLKTDWSPKLLNEQFKNDDFLNPRGTEGLGDGLRENFKVRSEDYFKNLNNFFDRELIDPSYVYSLLRGVDEILRNQQSFSNEQYVALLNFFNVIRLSGEANEFQKSDDKSWHADWITVHKIISDIILNVLGKIKDSDIFKDNRDTIFLTIKYLLSIKSSPDAEHEKSEYGEPSHVAINSVRGEAYRAFVQFTYNEGKTLAADVKKLYELILDQDPATAVRFTIGQFLSSFYFRDKVFIKSLLPKIFPKNEPGKEKIYFATWEGYLASALYEELFTEFQEYYAYAISITSDKYPDRKYLKGLDETLAGHLALAYAQFDLKIEDKLFQSFWTTPSETRHYEFASFTGRHYLTRSQASDKWLEENKVNKQKIVDFWNWILKTDIPLEAKTFSGFGFWINADVEIIDDKIVVENIAAALKKSNGVIDWDYGLLRRIDKFAEINPGKTLEIITSLLILNDGLNPHHRTYFDASNQIKEPLEIIYKNPELKKPVEDLINSLIEKGSSTFWGLKDVLK